MTSQSYSSPVVLTVEGIDELLDGFAFLCAVDVDQPRPRSELATAAVCHAPRYQLEHRTIVLPNLR